MNANPTPVHAARVLGEWLRAKRMLRHIVARVFSGHVWLTHAKYAEVELGVARWITGTQELLIPLALGLSDAEKAEFQAKLAAARASRGLCFSDIFSRDDLKPIRACHHEGKQLTKDDEDRILNVVFAPLA